MNSLDDIELIELQPKKYIEHKVFYEDRLKRFYKHVDAEVNCASKIVKRNLVWYAVVKIKENIDSMRKAMMSRKTKFIFSAMCITSLLVSYLLLSVEPVEEELKTNMIDDYAGNVISVRMNKDTKTLEYSVDSLSIKTADGYLNTVQPSWLSANLDTNNETYTIDSTEFKVPVETQLYKMDIQNNYVYMQYSNSEKTGNKEFIWSDAVPKTIDTSLIQQEGSRFFEKSNILQCKSYCNSFSNSFLMLSETLGGGRLNKESLKSELTEIEGSITQSSISFEPKLEIKLDELGTLDLCKIKLLGDNPQVVYDSDTDVLRIRNAGEDADYIYITDINNEALGTNMDSFIATNYDGLFIHYDFDTETSINFKTFAVLTDNNIYCFRLNRVFYKDLQEDLFNQLGIKLTDIEIKKIQRVVENGN